MDAWLADFIRIKRIDSFQKLRLLIFFHHHPQAMGTSREFAKWLYLANVSLLEKIIIELQTVGLVDCIEERYTLRDEPAVKSALRGLARAFENPLARQVLLNHINSATPSNFKTF
jgi:hypothetical protein